MINLELTQEIKELYSEYLDEVYSTNILDYQKMCNEIMLYLIIVEVLINAGIFNKEHDYSDIVGEYMSYFMRDSEKIN